MTKPISSSLWGEIKETFSLYGVGFGGNIREHRATLFFKLSPKDIFIDLIQRGRGRERETLM